MEKANDMTEETSKTAGMLQQMWAGMNSRKWIWLTVAAVVGVFFATRSASKRSARFGEARFGTKRRRPTSSS